MLITTDGIVIRERFIGENDKYIDILTRDLGVIEISVKGAKKINSKNSGSTQLFCYSKFCFSQRGDRYYMNSSEPLKSFYNIRLDIEKFALASYFAQVIKSCVMPLDSSEPVLRLFLNCLHFMAEDTRDLRLLKSIFELRLSGEIGLMPDILGCSRCKEYSEDSVYFNVSEGFFICKNCITDKDNISSFILINQTQLHIIRYILLTDYSKLFNFKAGEESIKKINRISEEYIISHLNRKFSTLDFYKNL